MRIDGDVCSRRHNDLTFPAIRPDNPRMTSFFAALSVMCRRLPKSIWLRVVASGAGGESVQV